ncbi:vitamin K epoxide reductase family protein [Agreia sp. COWG]|uniref:vitamin K epoxide reductase family protein n=1 Tax=Agreia sp. COWG TaxID=2773266 RepID=UPI001F42DDF3|nr:vitamin K epoxide reductase family protein [Agreia sp. COWG]
MADTKLETRRPFVFAIFLIVAGVVGWIAAFALTIDKFETLMNPSYSPSCDISPLVQCGVNLSSAQGSVFGFPNPLIGLAAFTAPVFVGVAILAGARFARWFWILFNVGVLGGIAFVIWLVSESIFVLGTLCPYCMVVWSVMIPMFFYVTVFNLKEGHFGNSGASRSFFGRLYPFTWILVLLGYLTIVALAQFRLDAITTIFLYS